MSAWDVTILVAVAAAGGWMLAIAARRGGARWWERVSLLSGLAIAVVTIVSPLDRWGREGLLASHLGQHILLGDLAAALILLGLPPALKAALRRRLERLPLSRAGERRLLAVAVAPVGALVVWTIATYVWLLPPVHRAATPAGPVHALDHVAFIAFGMLIWLAAFDPRRPRSLRAGLREGGLPWWGRHLYAMTSRIVLLPPAIAIWIADAASYHDLSAPWPFPVSQTEDQELAASVMIGFEMILFAVAVFLGLVFLIVASNRAGPDREPW